MLSHSDWLSKRGYVRHLQVMQSIKQRKNVLTARKSQINVRTKKNRQSNSRESVHQSPNKGISLRQQEVIWANYHLGKRIIETSPVISKRKHQESYKLHSRLVKGLTISTKKSKINDFRLKKLQQFQENIDQITGEKLIIKKTLHHNYYIIVHFKKLQLYHFKENFENVKLYLRYQQIEPTNCKKYKQSTECISYQKFFSQKLYFTIRRKQILQNTSLCFQMNHIKGLKTHNIGFFTFQFDRKQMVEKSLRIFHCGKIIGEIQLHAQIGTKDLRNFQQIENKFRLQFNQNFEQSKEKN